MKVTTIETGLFKLDGGAMFGVVPKSLWQRLSPPDTQNRCTWSARCLLVETEDRKILFDTGLGDQFDDKFRKHFEPHGTTTLMQSLSEYGLTPDDITDVCFTHLHFDHAGGALVMDEQGNSVPRFPNARYWTNQAHYDWAIHPNPREKASYLSKNFAPLLATDRLHFIDFEQDQANWLGIKLYRVYGHTEAMIVPIVPTQDTNFVFCADLIPSSYHLKLPYVMSYDVRPLKTLEEKEWLLEAAVQNDYCLIFEHDPNTVAVRLKQDERGRIQVSDSIPAHGNFTPLSA